LGTGSMLDALFMLVHGSQMSGRDELFRAYDMVTRNPLRGAGRDWAIEAGRPANLIVLDCADEVEAVRLRPAVRWVVRDGRGVAETPPAPTRVIGRGWEQPVDFGSALGAPAGG